MIALIVVAACVVIPVLLLRSGGTRQSEDGLTVLSENPSDQAAAALATPASTSVDAAVDQILSPSGTSSAKPATGTAASTTAAPAKPAASTASAPAAKPASSAPAAAPSTSDSKATKPASTNPPATGSSVVSHTVKKGDTVSGVATALGVSAALLRASNRLYESQPLEVGQVLYASRAGVIHTIKSGQTLTDISLTYSVPVGKLTAANGLTTGSTIYAGSRIVIPGATSALWDTVSGLSKGVRSDYIWPLGGKVVSGFGWRVHEVLKQKQHHDGIDIDVPEGTVVRASAPGRVYFYGEQPGYGNVLIIEHASKGYSLYGHLSSSLVYVGQYVEAGQRVALSGNTGVSSGPHLHFELRNGEFPVDPMRYLP
ncbi:MAG: M23 family metallopeptidase [Candidatus Bipolaricaulis sp.]|nr:M23 family metallopeptidase [Candidatus Bipolaricaulis sp.]